MQSLRLMGDTQQRDDLTILVTLATKGMDI